MTNTTSDYRDDQSWARIESRKPWVREAFESRFGDHITDMTFLDSVEDQRKFNYDVRIIFESGRELSTELKIRREAYNDVVLEYYHSYGKGIRKQGWMFCTQANFVSLLFKPYKYCIVLDMRNVRKFIDTEDWKSVVADRKHNWITADTGGLRRHHTYSIKVPIDMVRKYDLTYDPTREKAVVSEHWSGLVG